jgi:glycosyltransferase involved in cell wall biosynthesis
MASQSSRLVSIVIPLFNETESLQLLHSRISTVMRGLSVRYEIVFINDGSTDSSAEVLHQLFESDPHVRVLHFRKNFGKAAALSAGFAHSSGEIIITMDADLQDLPEEIPVFLEKIDSGFDLVTGWKYPRRDPVGKRLASKLFNRVVSIVFDLKLHDMNCGFKAYRRELLPELRLYGDMHRYIPVLAHVNGFRVGELKVKHVSRQFGFSKYGIGRMISGFFDLFTVIFLSRFSSRPLHVFGLIGFLVTIVGAGITSFLLVQRMFFDVFLSNRPLFYFALSLSIVGLQVFFFGLLAELITHSKKSDNFYSIRTIESHNPASPEIESVETKP